MDKKKADALQGQFDALKAQFEDLKKVHADSSDPAKFASRVSARVSLEKTASKFLGERDFGSLSDAQIKSEVVKKFSPNLKTDSVSADYLDGAYAQVIEGAAAKAVAIGEHKQRLALVASAIKTDSEKTAAQKAYDQMQKDNANAWKTAK